MPNTKNIFAPKSNANLAPEITPEVEPVTPALGLAEAGEKAEESATTFPDSDVNLSEKVKSIAPHTAEEVVEKAAAKKVTRMGSKQHAVELGLQVDAQAQTIVELLARQKSDSTANRALGNQLLAVSSQVKVLQDTIVLISSTK